MGGFGSSEAFAKRNKFYTRLFDIIAKWCTPAEVFAYEAANHECSYTGDYTPAAEIVLSFWDNKETAQLLASYGHYIEPTVLNKYLSQGEEKAVAKIAVALVTIAAEVTKVVKKVAKVSK
ncbi:MAG: hypothetical protein FWH43_00520 [Endomicrobia bacterium]|nr:hypothetical protein [Endomicrobiia bacterium]